MTVSDIHEAGPGQAFSPEDLDDAIWRLCERFVVEKTGDLLSLHRFVLAFVSTEVARESSDATRQSIAESFGRYAFARATEAHQLLSAHVTPNGNPLDAETERLSNAVFRYAIPASRLLISIGDLERAKQLPLQVKGTLREMVFYFYQEAKNYQRALEYAEKWLSVSPGDLEIMLYQARCYRNSRTSHGWAMAETILGRIEGMAIPARFRARVLRERALIAEGRGDFGAARRCFEDGIRLSPASRYPDNHVGLASLLLRQSPEEIESADRNGDVARAVELLEEASKWSSFDRIYLGLYIEALVRDGREVDAYPILQESLERDPSDPRLNYWFGEAARRQGDFATAILHGRRATSGGMRKGAFTVANALCSWVVAQREDENNPQRLSEALDVMNAFVPEFGTDKEIASGIMAKICRLQGDWDGVRRHIQPYEDSRNPYTVYESTILAFSEIDAAAIQDPGLAHRLAEEIVARLAELKAAGIFSAQLRDLYLDAIARRDRT